MADGVDPAEVQKAMAAVADLQAQLNQAFEAGDAVRAERLMADLSAAERRRNRLMQRALSGGAARFDATLPIREQVARVLALLSRPAAVSLIRDVANARFGDSIAGPRLASLRRDEHRSWQAATRGEGGQRAVGRPVYVTPALTYDRMAPVRGVLALSSWPLELRLLAPASHRVDMLHIIDKLAAGTTHSPDAPWAPDLRRLLWRLGRTVPGAEGADLAKLRTAVKAELSQLHDADAAERSEAASRARKQLDEEQLLFGARLTIAAGGAGKAAAAGTGRDRAGDA